MRDDLSQIAEEAELNFSRKYIIYNIICLLSEMTKLKSKIVTIIIIVNINITITILF